MTGRLWIVAYFILSSCSQTDKVSSRKYFDLKKFIGDEVIRLELEKPVVNKTVSRNGSSESRENISPNWDTELSLFAESNINKPAWSDRYRVRITDNITSFTALDPSLRTRSIVIKKNKKGAITEIEILNSTKNYLYSASEKLFYFPDSLYRIIKKQDVVVIGSNNYEISGILR